MIMTMNDRTRSELNVQRVVVTPEMAMKWLEERNVNNRRLNEKRIRTMARDIAEGRWMLTHVGIAFSTTGALIDGQHRLWAIIEADTPAELLVWQNVDPKSMMVIDCGKSRSMADILNIAGENEDVNRDQVAVLRAMLGGFSCPPNLSPSETSEMLRCHGEAIRFAMDNLPHITAASGVNTAITRAVIARAYYTVETLSLEKFCRMLTTGVVTSEDESVIVLLRQQLLAARTNSSLHRIQRYGKVERTLLAWLRGENPSRIYSASTELFPLPEEEVEA